jgi:hypothetical protein
LRVKQLEIILEAFIMTTYTLTTGTQEDFNNVQSQLISDFTEQFTGAEVTNQLLGTGKIVSCLNLSNNFESVIFTVYFDLDVTKRYVAAAAISCGGLKFVDESMVELYTSFKEVHNNLKHQLFEAQEEAKCRAKAEQKKADQLKKAEANYERLKEKSIQDFEELTQRVKQPITKADEFYYALGWLAAHVGSITAKLPDYLGPAFEKYFGAEAPKTLVDARARTSGGYAKQWSWEFVCTIKKLKESTVPACLQTVTTDFSKGIHNTAFIWDLVSNYGFKFGKKQDTLEIMRCVPIEYVPMFNEGLKA